MLCEARPGTVEDVGDKNRDIDNKFGPAAFWARRRNGQQLGLADNPIIGGCSSGAGIQIRRTGVSLKPLRVRRRGR